MSRPLRIQFPDAWYHVMNRGRRRENIYIGKNDYQLFLDLVKEASNMFTVNVSGYCLMNNHYHMLIQTPRANISRFMRHVDGVYTQTFNKCYCLDGSLFKGRYKSILIEDDEHLLQILRYIHRNPLEAGLESQLGTYPWYSYNSYLNKSKEWDWIYKDFLLSMFSESKPDAINQYKAYMKKENPKEIADMFKKKNLPSIFGSEGFMEEIKNRFSRTEVFKEIPESKMLLPDISFIRKVICRYYQVDESVLLKTRQNESNEARKMAIFLVKQIRGDKLADIAQEFGVNKYSSVSSVVTRFKEDLKSDGNLLKRYEEIVSIIKEQ